jgi:hypothetical protein
MRQVQTLVQLSEELVALLDQRAAREGVARSSVIRMAVEAFVDFDRLIDAQIATGYRAHPQAPNDPWILHAERRRRDAWSELDW